MKRASPALTTFGLALVSACGSFDAAPDKPATTDASADASAISDAGPDGGDGGGAGSGRPAFVQVNTMESPSGQPSATVRLNPLTAHHAVILGIAILGSATVTSITDTLGGKFVTVVGPSQRSNGDSILVAFAPDIPMGGSESITVTTTAFGGRILLYAHEYENVTAFDVGLGGSGTTPGMIVSPKITTKSPNELLFGFAITGLATEGPGFIARSRFDANVTEDRILDVAGEASATAIVDQSWVIIGAAFR